MEQQPQLGIVLEKTKRALLAQAILLLDIIKTHKLMEISINQTIVITMIQNNIKSKEKAH